MSGSTFEEISAAIGGNEKAPPAGENRGDGAKQRGDSTLDYTGNGRSPQGAEAMKISTRDAWLARRLLCGKHEPADMANASPGFRPVAERLAQATFEDKQRERDFYKWLDDQPDDFIEDFQAAMRAREADPNGPPPAEAEPGVMGDDWPPLRLREAPPAEPFPLDAFPPSLARFAREVADSVRTAADIPALGMLTVAGAAIGQSVQAYVDRGWTQPALLYAVAIARPGRGKTPALRYAVQPLSNIDKRLRAESRQAKADWEEARDKAREGGPPPGPEPPQLRAITKDVTRESVAIILKDNPRGVLRFNDEALAWVNSWNQYKGGKGTDEQFELSLYDCDTLSVDRKGGREGIYIEHPFSAFLGGIQPKLVHKLRGEGGTDNGFHDRIAFACPDTFPKRIRTKGGVSEEAERAWAEAIERLHAVPMRVIDDEDVQPWYASLRPEADDRFTAWVEANGEAIEQADDEDREGMLAKAEGRLIRLALILSRLRLACDPSRPLLEGDRVPPIELEDIEGAERLTAYFINHADRVAVSLHGGARSANASTVLRWIKRHRKGEFREADVRNHLRGFHGNPAALADALESLERDGAIRPKPEPPIPGKRGPKSTPLYEVRPELL